MMPVSWAHLLIAGLLLEYDADPNAKNGEGRTPLHLLLEDEIPSDDSGQVVGLLESLLERGADANAQDTDIDKSTPLHQAIKLGSYEVARILIKYGADPNMKNDKGKTPLHLLLEQEYRGHVDINDVLVVVRLLVESGADVNALDEGNTTPLYLASNHHNPELAQIIFNHINVEKDCHRALLHLTLEGKCNFQAESPSYTNFSRVLRRREYAEQGPHDPLTLGMLLWKARDDTGAAQPW
jgi:ankyrin repeat protein